MTLKPWMRDFLWMATGAALLLGVVLVVFLLHKDENPSRQLARKVDRIERVARIRLAMATASEAEKSAVMAITDEESQTFADQARAATAQADRERRELKELLAADGTADERKLLDHFSQAFVDLQRIDADLLVLAVKNTNLKASSLAFGPAAAAIKEMEAALGRLVARTATSAGTGEVARLASGVQVGALHIQILFAPHIAEESDQKMDALEGLMAKEEHRVREDLDALAKVPRLSGDPDLAAVVTSYARFHEVKARILALSRENTNVRSLAISLMQKRKAALLCNDALLALQQALQAEPVAGFTYPLPASPRSLGPRE
jgi:hypothetical protein